MKNLLTLLSIFFFSLTFTLNIYSKNEKINSEKVVSLVTTGYGISKDEAKPIKSAKEWGRASNDPRNKS